MNNKHIELVKKWLADKDSVSPEELKANSRAAYAAAYGAAYGGARAANANAAAYAAAYADDYADAAARDAAKYWVECYEKLENSLTEA